MFLFLLASMPWIASIQPNQSNDLVLHNGPEGIYSLTDPSVGAPSGTFPPDLTGDLFWKVFPRELLRHPQGTMELSGLRFLLTNLGSVSQPVFWDLWITRGQASATYPGLVEPDWGDPGAVFLSLGPTGLPGICALEPLCCDPAGCVTCLCDGPPPYTGCSPLWSIELLIGTVPGTGIPIVADGSQDLTVTAFSPGGMVYSNQPCAAVDYSTMYFASVDEKLHDWTGTQISGYGGWQLGGLGPFPDDLADSSVLQLQFVEPTISPYVQGDLTPSGLLPGLAGLRPAASAGAVALGVHHRARQAAADGDRAANDLALCAATLGPQLMLPGVSVLGAQLLLNPFDPAFAPTAAVWNGAYVHWDYTLSSPYAPDDDVVFNAAPLFLPPALVGTDVHCQCLWLDLLTLVGAASNTATVHVH